MSPTTRITPDHGADSNLQLTKRNLVKNYKYQESQFLVGPNSDPVFQHEGKRFSSSYKYKYFALGKDLFRSLDHVSDAHGQQSSITCKPNQVIPGTDLRLKNDPLEIAGIIDLKPAFPNITIMEGDINRWKMAVRAFERFQDPHSGLNHLNGPFRRHVPNMPDFEDIFREFPLALGFSAAAITYGGLHALAWFAQFRSPTEQLLWRISSVAVMSEIPIMAATNKFLTSSICIRRITLWNCFSTGCCFWGFSYRSRLHIVWHVCT